MNQKKIAVLCDSCCDVPPSIAEENSIYVIPVLLNYQDASYRDGVDITPEGVYRKLPHEIPKTSLPTGQSVLEMYERIVKDGYEQLIVVTLSSQLSGTHNFLRLMAEDFTELEIHVFDTKNIAIASGFFAIYAKKLVDEGLLFQDILDRLYRKLDSSKVFFAVDTLEYLQKGGRIGLVTSIIGTALGLKPIISCNDEGIYHTIAKVRGSAQSHEKIMELARSFIGDSRRFFIAICHGGAPQVLEIVKHRMEDAIAAAELYCEGQISPSLGVHTGPGLIGIGVMLL